MLNEEEREVWRRIGCAAACDAMEMLSMRRAIITGLRCTVPGSVIVGTACTVRQIPKHGTAEKSERLVRHETVARDLARPGQVIVMDVGGRTDVASWGEVHSRRCLHRGISGLIINGCIRDASKIRTMGFPVACIGFSPVKGQWDLETASVNEPVTIGHVQVRPDDLIVADEDGLVVIPPSRAQEVQETALAIIEQEKAL